jgi:plastocyanin
MHSMQRAPMLAISAVILLAIAGLVVYLSNTKTTPQTEVSVQPAATAQATSTPEAMESTSGAMTSSVKEITVTASSFKFDPSTIKVKQGDTVKLTYKNFGGMHDWVVDEFSARTKVLQSGQQETIEFVADKAGTYEYYCSVGNHRAMGMKGQLIVE